MSTSPVSLHPNIDSPDYFAEASAAYLNARDEYWDAQDSALTNAHMAAQLRERMKDVEAEAICNGQANGKNSEERDASLRVYLAKDPAAEPYRKAQRELRSYELAKGQAENQAASAANEMSLQRRRMDAYVASTNRAAAIAANAGSEGVGK